MNIIDQIIDFFVRLVRGRIDLADAESMIYESAYGLATRAYKL